MLKLEDKEGKWPVGFFFTAHGDKGMGPIPCIQVTASKSDRLTECILEMYLLKPSILVKHSLIKLDNKLAWIKGLATENPYPQLEGCRLPEVWLISLGFHVVVLLWAARHWDFLQARIRFRYSVCMFILRFKLKTLWLSRAYSPHGESPYFPKHYKQRKHFGSFAYFTSATIPWAKQVLLSFSITQGKYWKPTDDIAHPLIPSLTHSFICSFIYSCFWNWV